MHKAILNDALVGCIARAGCLLRFAAGKCWNATVLLLMAAVCLNAPSAAAGERAPGRDLALKGGPGAPPCAQCHGANGEGQATAGFPRLASLPHDYIVKQLNDFRSGRRTSPIMEPIAKALASDAITGVAAYYANLQAPAAVAAQSTAGNNAAVGARLARNGDWDNNIPACFACHGDNGTGIGPHFPPIAYQPAAYIAKQLRDWKTGARRNDPNGLMKSVADRLSDVQIEAVSTYLQALPQSAR